MILVLSLAGSIHSWVTSVSKYLLRTYSVPNSILGAWETLVCKRGIIFALSTFAGWWGCRADDTDKGDALIWRASQEGLPMERQARQGASPQFQGLMAVSAALGAVRIESDNVQKPLGSLLPN